MGLWKRLFGNGISDNSKSESTTTSASKFSDIRLEMALSKAVQQKFNDSPPEMIAAVMLAMTDKNRKDLVERPEGIYLSQQCADRISSYAVWLADDGEIIVTRKRLEGKPDKPKKDSLRFLNKRLPKAQKLGVINSLQYAAALTAVFDLNKDDLVVRKNNPGAMAIY